MRGRAQWAEADRVAHGVAHQRPLAVQGLDLVGVMPEPVGAADLDVDEAVGRLPGLDERVPPHGHAVQAQAVLKEAADAHLDRRRRDELEAQQRRRDRLEVGGIGKEGEGVLRTDIQDLLAAQRVGDHHHPAYP
jgi:hypothetical protein